MTERVLILGLDGATWRILDLLLETGELPNLSALIKQGARGILYSSIPPLTAPAWATFQTGANPGKHGIFDFRIFDRTKRKLWLVSARDLKLPTLWHVASQAGRRVLAINVPMTYPPQPVNGIIIGGLLAGREDRTLLYPPDRYDDILGKHQDYRISPPLLSRRGLMGRRAFVDACIAVERARCELALDLIKREPWHLCMIQNQSLDYIQHAYYHLMDRSAPEFDPVAHRDVLRFYKAMDENIGRLVEAVPDSTDIVILSDHGFKLQHRLIHLASWLRKEGFMEEKIGFRQRLLQVIRAMDRLKLRRHFAHWILKDKRSRFSAAAQAAINRIDWDRSRAFAIIGSVFGCLHINHSLDGDDKLTDELAQRLLELTDPRSGRKVVKRIRFGRDVYHGPFALNGPDLIAEPEEDYSFGAPSLIAHQEVFTDIDFDLEIPGGHHPAGIIIWAGNGVRREYNLQAELMDVAPTVLARLGISIPDYMDGKALDSLFTSPLKIEYQHWWIEMRRDSGYSSQDEEILRKRLSDLGYL